MMQFSVQTMKNLKDDFSTLVHKMTLLINKLADWSPVYHKTARNFPQIFCTP